MGIYLVTQFFVPAPLKRSSIDRQTNTHILMLFIILLALSLLSAACSELWVRTRTSTSGGLRDWYIGLDGKWEERKDERIYSSYISTTYHNIGKSIVEIVKISNSLLHRHLKQGDRIQDFVPQWTGFRTHNIIYQPIIYAGEAKNIWFKKII